MSQSGAGLQVAIVDERAATAARAADPEVADAWTRVTAGALASPPDVGLAAGERPAADVEVLAGLLASAEYDLARRMHRALASGSLPLVGPGAMLRARGWSSSWARRLARCGPFAEQHPTVAQRWAAGVITSEHVDAVARRADRFTTAELDALLAELCPRWGAWSPTAVGRFVLAADRMLHPPSDPTDDETDSYASRGLDFAVLGDTVVLAGTLPRVEGELVMAAIDALAERLRTKADHVPAPARRADALVELVNRAGAAGALPTRGGLPVSVSVSLQVTGAGDIVATTARGHLLTRAETRWSCCDAEVSPVLVDRSGHCPPVVAGSPAPAAARIAALASTLFDTRLPLAVGRTERTATPAQRRALAARDGGCVLPGCEVPAEACQAHHLVEWAAGGATDVANLVLLCWTHHRQVDLGMWEVTSADRTGPSPEPEPGAPPGTPWPANHGAPWVITRTPRSRWRL